MMHPFGRDDVFGDFFGRPSHGGGFFDSGPFSDPFFADRALTEYFPRHGYSQYPTRPNMFDYMNRQMDAMMNRPFGAPYSMGMGYPAVTAPWQHPSHAYPFYGQHSNYHLPPAALAKAAEAKQGDASNAQAPVQGRWFCETKEGIWDGESDAIVKKTRSSFDTQGGILKRESQKKIGDKTLNVVKTKKIAHPSELTDHMTWDTETRSLPKNDPFKAEWKQAKKKLTAGNSTAQHPPANTHKALFNNMYNPALPPKSSP